MKAIIYHNPMCGTSRKTLELLRDSGCDVWIHEYMKNPPSRDELAGLYQRAGITPREGLRAKEPLADELGLNRPDVTDDEVLDAMVAHPILINRPILPLDGFHLSRSLRRTLRSGRFEVRHDQDFAAVVTACADREETWINGELERAMLALHQSGHAHSIEVRRDGDLVGGLYGVKLGRAFFGESMFS